MIYNLLEYLECTADSRPDKIAFADGDNAITFEKLREKSKRIGSAIAKRVQKTRVAIAVLTRHNAVDVTAFMGALYAGCFYVPIDAEQPENRILSMIQTVDAEIVIDEEMLSVFEQNDIDEELIQDIRAKTLDIDPAYVIFTSGSTGLPKGAVITHRAVIDLTEWLRDTFEFDDSTVFGNQTPFYFDASVKEIYATLCCGATTYILDKKLFMSPLKLMKRIDELRINTLLWATAAVKLVAISKVFEKYVPKHIANVFFAGENMSAKVLNIWRGVLPDVRYVNLYGPTEITVDCSYYIVSRVLKDEESVPIGFACRNMEIMLLDGDIEAAVGESGEIVVRGIGVGLGYYNDVERSNMAFVQNPLNHSFREIVYRTGDIAKLNEFGELVYLSRKDGQIKHMGSRVELGEVETAASAVDGVELLCCGFDKESDKIVMFYQGSIDVKQLLNELNLKLPRYMMPNEVKKLEDMPLTPNGKIDRNGIWRDYCEKS